jgi:MFS family permease
VPPDPLGSRPSRRAWLVWAVAVLAYGVAVFHRASLGVTGLAAQERLGAGAAELSLLAVLQLGLYAAMQVPVGVLLDRFGTRAMVTTGALVMATGQAVLAVADDVPTAVAARALVGTGDAMTFISVLRLVPAWFGPRQVPVVTQMTGLLGQLGQVAAAFPLVALLTGLGWTTTFLAAAVVGLAAAVVAGAAIRDTPGEPPLRGPLRLAGLPAQVREVWVEPGRRLGFWTHFTAQFSGTVFALLWGYPFLVEGEEVSPAVAGALLSLLVLAGIVVGPVVGALVARWPLRRSVLVLAVTLTTALAWTVVLLWPGPAPLPLLVVLVLVLATNGPGSMVAFDYARTFTPPERLGVATGVANVGGFVASLVTILLIGLTLDLVAGGGRPGLDDYRLAFSVQYAVWAVGLIGVVRNRRAVRRRLAAEGQVFDALPRAVVRRLRSRGTRVG